MNVRHPMGVLNLFSIKKFFMIKCNSGFFYFRVTISSTILFAQFLEILAIRDLISKTEATVIFSTGCVKKGWCSMVSINEVDKAKPKSQFFISQSGLIAKSASDKWKPSILDYFWALISLESLIFIDNRTANFLM